MIISLGVVVANLTTPVLVQLVFDRGFDGGFRPVFVGSICAAAFALVVLTFVAARSATNVSATSKPRRCFRHTGRNPRSKPRSKTS